MLVNTIVLNYLQYFEDSTEEASTASVLLTLPILSGTSCTRGKRTKCSCKPFPQEVNEGFITYVGGEADVKKTQIRRRGKLARFNLTVQPFIIIVGTSLQELTHYLVIVDNTYYKVTSLLELTYVLRL